LVSLFTLRRVLKNIFMGHITAINSDVLEEGFVGTEGVVLEKIAPNAPGKVMINGTRWKAESVETIEPDQPIVVVEQKSLTVIVKSK
jgi:membrane protein implicated in regulation of membrane protease activity